MSQSICDQIFCLSSDNQIISFGCHVFIWYRIRNLCICLTLFAIEILFKQKTWNNVMLQMFCRSFRYWPSDLPIWFHFGRSCEGQRSAPRRCSTTRTIKLQDQGFFCFAVGIHRIATNLISCFSKFHCHYSGVVKISCSKNGFIQGTKSSPSSPQTISWNFVLKASSGDMPWSLSTHLASGYVFVHVTCYKLLQYKMCSIFLEMC